MPIAQQPAGGATPAGAKATVLLVDDGPENRLLVRGILERAGYRVLVADSGPSGLEALQRERADLVALDFMMPGMDGAEVARRIRADQRTRDIPIMMLTASSEEPHIEEAFAAGANDYITKPVDRRILVARVEAMIRAVADERKARAAVDAEREWNEIRTDLTEAASIQQAQLPALPAQTAGWAIAGALVPSRHIGGDLFDLSVGAAGEPVLAVVDVSGHGLAAALVASSVCSQIKALVRHNGLAETMALLNMQLCQESTGKYACVAVVALGRGRVRVVNAGLPPICVVRGGQCLAQVEGAGVPPGLVASADYVEETLDLAPGDRLVVMSDGLTEPFGAADRVQPTLDGVGINNPSLDTKGLLSPVLAGRIRTLLGGAAPEARDDATLVIAQLIP